MTFLLDEIGSACISLPAVWVKSQNQATLKYVQKASK